MPRFAPILAGILLCATSFAQSALDATTKSLLHPDAGLLLGIEWRRIMDSPVGAELRQQMLTSGMPKGFEAVTQALDGLDAVFLVSPAKELAKAGKNPPMLVVLKGRFDAESVRGWFKGKSASETYRQTELITPSNMKPATTRLALLDAGTLLFGERREVVAALDRRAGAREAGSGALLHRAAALSAGNDIWAIILTPPNAFDEAPPAARQIFSNVTAMELGMNLSAGLGMQVNLRTRTPESAPALAQAIQGLIAMASMAEDQRPEALEVLRKIQITSEPSGVRMALSVDRTELERRIQQMRAGTRRTASVPSRPPVSAPTVSTGSDPTAPQGIRIQGLDPK